MLNWAQKEARTDCIMLILANLFRVLIANMLGAIRVSSERRS
jgi:hypothetical protein